MNLPLMKIGITYTGTDEKQLNYINWLSAFKGVEIITLSAENTDHDTIKLLDGIVLTGGVDIHPKNYNCTITNYLNAPEKFNELRDEFEREVFNISQVNRIPLLAVCRGMQLVNCILGGSLVQDIGVVSSAVHQFNKQDRAHGINIVAGSLLHNITGVERTIANSAHHQAINVLGNNLQINALADDGIIEGIEWEIKKDRSFLLGIQWHPERMYKFNLAESSVSKNISAAFIEAIIKIKENIV